MKNGNLVLTRRFGEAIQIDVGGEIVTVSVASINGKICRLAINAPKHVQVLRTELLERKQGVAQ